MIGKMKNYSISAFAVVLSCISISRADPSRELELPTSQLTVTEKHSPKNVACPCFSLTNGLMWANTRDDRSGALTVDIHRPSSCKSDGKRIAINWAEIYSTQGGPDELLLDGVRYNYLSAVYDPDNEIYQCGREDTRFKLDPRQAEVCMQLLQDACESAADRICPCFSMSDLALATNRVQEGSTILNEGMTCVNPNGDGEGYGLYQISDTDLMGFECDSCTTHVYAVQTSNTCFDGTDIAYQINDFETQHCFSIMENTCSRLDTIVPRPLCSDDPDFFYNGNERRNCEWVRNQTERKKYCNNKIHQGSYKRVFEFCRETCGYCSCEDDENFLFNGQDGMGCAWAAQENTDERCESEGVAENCINTCSTKCCEDKPLFEYSGKSWQDCDWVAGKTSKNPKNSKNSKNPKNRTDRLCRQRSVAVNCPDTCDKCPA